MNAQNNPQPTQSSNNPTQSRFPKSKPNVGSLFAGIGGFDLGLGIALSEMIAS